MQQVSRGELQLTDSDLIYFRPFKEPIRWPLEYIRRYAYENGTFILQCSRRSKTGENILGFRVGCGEDLVNRLEEKMNKCPSIYNNNIPKRTDLNQLSQTITTTNNNNTNSNRVPRSPLANDQGSRRDAGTSGGVGVAGRQDGDQPGRSDPFSYTQIDFDTTKALNESAQAHAANRVK